MTPKATHSADAWLSPCGTYRYALWRYWASDMSRTLHWVMLNPSTASYTEDDPTIRLCMRRAHDMGFSGIRVTNLYAYRTPTPIVLKRAEKSGVDVVGPENGMAHDFLQDYAVYQGRSMILCAWGAHAAGTVQERAFLQKMEGIPLHALRLTTNGAPGHPLYIPLENKPFLWRGGL